MSNINTKDTRIYVLIGTKAQYIKTAPWLRLMRDQVINYVLIDSGQHAEFTKRFRKELLVKEPDAVHADSGNIRPVLATAMWFAKYIPIFLFGRRYLERTYSPAGAAFASFTTIRPRPSSA